ncbi:Hypothetical_protein [Hexamita inflata]|uniref:Hypothetical_protein n=1 Tax=Hexamita inflata TaxID=28002 RepID=A0AA86UJ77_9EUKA|nr:Hypothetical protein HINF_LOCUS41296 [Hexamita inflata]CAI9966129.1 Hypothetical protein HINF_LOCUS53774 [Hexamita inflata]
MPTQQRPRRALTESLADQFYLIPQHYLQKLVLASQFLFARYFLRFAREVVQLYQHLMHYFINLIRYLGSFLVYLILQTFLIFCMFIRINDLQSQMLSFIIQMCVSFDKSINGVHRQTTFLLLCCLIHRFRFNFRSF